VETCLACFEKLFAGEHYYSYDLADLGRYYRAYRSMMAHWRRVLPEGVMLEARYDRVMADPEREVRRLVEFCGLAWDPACLEGEAEPLRVRAWRPPADELRPLLDALQA
jgi:hypothetical protein